MTTLDPRITEYYERGEEADRLRGGQPTGPLELARTQELIERHLPNRSPLRVLDVGGGPGAYASWLVELGHDVHLVDPLELHVQQALQADPRIVAEVGDGRDLAHDNQSFDVVLLFGPLYHLVDRDDRLRTLAEARRVLVPGGLVFAASARGLFTTAYFHLSDDLVGEMSEVGFAGAEVFNVEGPGVLLADIEERWTDPVHRAVLLKTARAVESDPGLQAAGSHLLAVGTRPA